MPAPRSARDGSPAPASLPAEFYATDGDLVVCYSKRSPGGTDTIIELAPEVSPAHVFEVRRFVRSENQFEYFL